MSLNVDQVAQARRVGGTIASVLSSRLPDPYIQVMQGVSIQPDGAKVGNYMHVNVNIGPPEQVGSLASTFTANPSPWEFVIRGGSIQGDIQDLQLFMKFQVSNLPVTLPPMYNFFRSIQFFPNSSTTVADQYSSSAETLADALMYIEPEVMADWCTIHNCNRDGSTNSLPVGEYEFALDMKSTIISAMKYNTGLFSTDLRIRFIPNPDTQNLLAGLAANVAVTSANLWANVKWLSTDNQAARIASLRDSELLIPYVSFSNYQASGSYSITAGTPIRFSIQSSPGNVAGLLVYMLPVSPAAADYQTFVNLDTAQFEYLSNVGEIIMARQSGRQLRWDACRAEKNGSSLFALNKVHKIYPVNFVSSCDAVAAGSMSGTYFDTLNGSVLSITPATTVPGTYNVFVLILYQRTATINNGFVTMTNF